MNKDRLISIMSGLGNIEESADRIMAVLAEEQAHKPKASPSVDWNKIVKAIGDYHGIECYPVETMEEADAQLAELYAKERHTPQEEKPTVETDGHAWCPECKCSVPAIHITFEEMHDVCGQSIIWKDPVSYKPPANDDMVEELKVWKEKTIPPNSPQYYEHLAAWNRGHDKEFYEILSKYRPVKADDDGELVEELEGLYDSVLRNTDNKLALKVADDMFKIFSRYTPQESKPAVKCVYWEQGAFAPKCLNPKQEEDGDSFKCPPHVDGDCNMVQNAPANADMVAQLEAYCQLASPWINVSAEYADGMHQAKRDIEGIIKSCPVKANDDGELVEELKKWWIDRPITTEKWRDEFDEILSRHASSKEALK